MLKATSHRDRDGLETLNFTGRVLYADSWWNVGVWVWERPGGTWKIGRADWVRWYSLKHALVMSKVYGLPYQVSDSVRLAFYKDFEFSISLIRGRDRLLSTEIESVGHIVKIEPRQGALRFRSVSMENSQESKKLCQVVPLATSKAGRSGEAHCPRIAADNEFCICGGHFNFYKRGSQLRLLSGKVLNEKPAAAPVAAPVASEPAPVAEPVKESKTAKANRALKVLKEKKAKKQAQPDAIVPVAESSAVGQMAARSLPSAS
jgi:hypothetical protein